MKCFVIDLSLCTGCYCCQIACKDEHVYNDWSPYTKPQPETGHFWLKITEMERGTTPKVVVTYIPIMCMHCENPPCMLACPVGAIIKRVDGLTLIDPDKCNGCKACISSCPYEVVYFNDKLNKAQKCTGCAHIIDGVGLGEGQPKIPRCVDSCPTGAIKFGEDKDLINLMLKADVLKPEYVTKPKVYYINLPKPFITGSVYDPIKDECIHGANVTASDLTNGKTYHTKTDEFGDFWFKNLEWKHLYSIKISISGYYPITIHDIYTGKDVNIGDIPLIKLS